MPHFIIECSEEVLHIQPKEKIMNTVNETAIVSGLFRPNDIKVRVNSYADFIAGNGKENFIHIFGNIMQGRTTEQKANLSKTMVSKLVEILPNVPIVSMNIREFEKATYFNRSML